MNPLPKRLFLFCKDFVPMEIIFLFVEAAIKKCSTKIGVEKFLYAQSWSYPGILGKAFENTSEGITKK